MRQASTGEVSLRSAAAAMISSADKPRCRQIDQIVELGRRPAKIFVTLGVVADHAVGGIDGLVERAAGKAGNRHPQHRRDHAVGKVLGQAFDGRARHAGLIQGCGVAADNMGDREAARRDAALLKGAGDVRHVPVQAALGDQRACGERGDKQPKRQAEQNVLHQRGGRSDNDKDDQNRDDAVAATRILAIEAAVE